MSNQTDHTISEIIQQHTNDVFADVEAGTKDGLKEDLDALEKMIRIKRDLETQETTDAKNRISPDVLATCATNLIGIIAILNHERVHAVTSKAFGQVIKLATKIR